MLIVDFPGVARNHGILFAELDLDEFYFVWELYFFIRYIYIEEVELWRIQLEQVFTKLLNLYFLQTLIEKSL